jgi:hypothetical protein
MKKFQYGFVFGMATLAAFIFGPLLGIYGHRLGCERLYHLGGILQVRFITLFCFKNKYILPNIVCRIHLKFHIHFKAVMVLIFGSLEYVNHTWTFIGLSYICR